MKCPKCGKEIANDSNFCEFCGTQIRKTMSKICLLFVVFGTIVLLISYFFDLFDFNIVNLTGIGFIIAGIVTSVLKTIKR